MSLFSVVEGNVAFELLQLLKGNNGALESKEHTQTAFGGVLKDPNEQEQHQCLILNSEATARLHLRLYLTQGPSCCI